MRNHEQDRLSVVADALMVLTYSEMMELGESLADIFAANDRFDSTSRDDWASLLHSWAESYGEDQNDA